MFRAKDNNRGNGLINGLEATELLKHQPDLITICVLNKQIPDNSLVMGSPGKIIRQVTDEEIKATLKNAIRYQNNWKKYSQSLQFEEKLNE